jgi:hypothetical protein
MAGRTTTFRMPVLALLALPVGVACVGSALLGLAGAKHSAPVGSAGFYLIFLAVGMLALNCLLRVQVGPAGIRIRALRRNQLVRWAEIRAVTVEPHRNGRRVTLWTATGGPVKLPLPMTNKAWNEATFLYGYHQIGQYWLATRGI